MWYEIFTITGMLFWIVSAVVLLALAGLVSNDRIGLAGTIVAAYLLVLVGFTDANVVERVTNNPMMLVYGIAGYVAAGSIWSVIKWFLFLLNVRDFYEKARSIYMEKRNLKEIVAEDEKKRFIDYLKQQASCYSKVRQVRSFPPRASDHRGMIIVVMMFWPFSMLGTLCGDFIARVFIAMYNSIGGLMQRMSDAMFGKYSELN